MKTTFERIKARLKDLSLATPVSVDDTDKIKAEFPGIPREYTDFLEKIGFGEVGALRIYEAPISPDDIYPCPKGDLSGIILLGDDFQGYCFGFDTRKNFTIVEVEPRGNPRFRSEKGFLSLVAGYL